ncbi:MAG: hypothetical protein WCK18_18705 [Prolixibacteraceae bacterium]
MKRVFSILFASLILLSGLHFTVASHICCGQLAAVKYSITGEKATCGMETDEDWTPANGVIHSDCCKNRVNACSSDGNYFQSLTPVQEIASIDLFTFGVIPDFLLQETIFPRAFSSSSGPPLIKNYTSVDQSLLCVFLI